MASYKRIITINGGLYIHPWDKPMDNEKSKQTRKKICIVHKRNFLSKDVHLNWKQDAWQVVQQPPQLLTVEKASYAPISL